MLYILVISNKKRRVVKVVHSFKREMKREGIKSQFIFFTRKEILFLFFLYISNFILFEFEKGIQGNKKINWSHQEPS